jgi:hypothetical protein
MAGQSWTNHNVGKKIMFGGVYPAYAYGFTAYKYVKFNQILSYGINDSTYTGTGTNDYYPVYRSFTGHWSDLKRLVLRWSYDGKHVMRGNNNPLDITDVPVDTVIRGWCQVQGRLTALTMVGSNYVKVFSVPAEGLGLTVSWSTFSEDLSIFNSVISMTGGVCDGIPYTTIIIEDSLVFLLFDEATEGWVTRPLSTPVPYSYTPTFKQGRLAVYSRTRGGTFPDAVHTTVEVGPYVFFLQMYFTSAHPESECGPLVGEPLNSGRGHASYTYSTRSGTYTDSLLDVYFLSPFRSGYGPVTFSTVPRTIDRGHRVDYTTLAGRVNATPCHIGKAMHPTAYAFANVSYETIAAANQQVIDAYNNPALEYNNDSPPGPTIMLLYISDVFDVRIVLQWTMQGPPNVNRHTCKLVINGVEKWSGDVVLQIETYDVFGIISEPLATENDSTIVLFYMQENTIYVGNAQFFKIVLNKLTGESSVSTPSAGEYSLMTKQIFLSL